MTKFCPVCGGIMRVVKEQKKTVLRCPICGYEEVVKEVPKKPVDLIPAEIREEKQIKAGVIKDKKVNKIVIDEDTIREALEILEGKED
ncbi:MAG: hypothetical protein ACP6IP_09765 [Candidatus Njordarchaeia archaeon]